MKKLFAVLVLSISFALPMTWAAEDVTPAPAPAVTAPAAEGAAPTVDTPAAPDAPAPAADETKAAEEPGVMPTVFEGLHLLLTILGAAIVALLVVAVKKIAAKLGIQLSDEQLNLAQRLAEQALHYANAKAKQAGGKPAGESKLKSAVDYIKAHPEFTKLAKKYSDEKLVGLIESTLGQKKADGANV
jgi:hypothetical protein